MFGALKAWLIEAKTLEDWFILRLNGKITDKADGVSLGAQSESVTLLIKGIESGPRVIFPLP